MQLEDFLSLLDLDVERTTKIIAEFIRYRIAVANAKGAAINISGGIDSAVTAALTVRAVGKENVLGLFLPSKTTPAQDLDDFKTLTKQLGIRTKIIDIEPLIEQWMQLEGTMGSSENISSDQKRTAVGNFKARIRMAVLYYHANLYNYLTVGTGNKSELMVGYFTKYGDGGADLLPIADLYKYQVRQLARYLKIPVSIIEKPPSAGLWEGQTDEKELGITYNELDVILWHLERLFEPTTIAKRTGIPMRKIEKVQKLIKNSEHKRIGAYRIKLGYRTPGWDWRVVSQ